MSPQQSIEGQNKSLGPPPCTCWEVLGTLESLPYLSRAQNQMLQAWSQPQAAWRPSGKARQLFLKQKREEFLKQNRQGWSHTPQELKTVGCWGYTLSPVLSVHTATCIFLGTVPVTCQSPKDPLTETSLGTTIGERQPAWLLLRVFTALVLRSSFTPQDQETMWPEDLVSFRSWLCSLIGWVTLGKLFNILSLVLRREKACESFLQRPRYVFIQ